MSVTPTAGTGPGRVTLNVLSNLGPKRQGSVTVAGRTIAVTQLSGCTYTVKPDSLHLDSAAQTTGLDVTTNATCPLGAASSEDWIRVGSFQSTGSRKIPLTVEKNGSRNTRTATITVTGDGFTRAVKVEQDGR